MRKIFIFLALVLPMAGCTDDFFAQYPSNSITEGNFYQTDKDFNQAVLSCYHKLRTNIGFHVHELGYRSDENMLQAMAVSTQDRYDFDHFAENSSNGILSDVWNAWYNGIYRCNDILDHLQGRDDLPNAARYRGECLFLRAWWYFTLYRTFGGVPIATTVLTPSQAKLVPRASDAEMFELLVADLSQAATLLPDAPDADKARVSRIAAYALLAKVQLTFGKAAEAKASLEKALSFTAYGLEPTCEQVFSVGNKMNKEILFAVYYNKSTDNGHGYWYSANTNVMADINNPTVAFKAIYSAEDKRLPLVATYRKVSDRVYALTKWDDTYDATYTSSVGNDFPHLRYADVVLMYAEALVQSGSGIAEGLVYLNKTRSRAGLNPLTEDEVPNVETFIRELAAERGREFALEGQRWYDLVRLGLAVGFFEGMGYKLDSHNLIFPIPQAQIEIVNNPAVLWQNPGF